MRPLSNYSETLLETLEAQYPARCRLPKETEREHERYAGKVELIAEIRGRLHPDSTK